MTQLDALPYPDLGADRDRWILSQRPARNAVTADLPYAFLSEQERNASGDLAEVTTIFLTNRECPWRCLMCDLWRNTLEQSVPAGAIHAQIAYALGRLPPARHVKLYNSGSFFDPRAIPPQDYAPIAATLRGFERVIVESHPVLVGERTLLFRDLLSARLEVAMGLETVHPDALERLNKRMTLEQFRTAADFLRSHQVDLRVFVLVQPPFIPVQDALLWAQRSVDFAFDCGATAVSVIPTRASNGAMEALQRTGDFSTPSLRTLEATLEYGISVQRGRVFADLWDMARLDDDSDSSNNHFTTDCPTCLHARIERLRAMNLSQTLLARPACSTCGAVA